jgi:mono/diheme cytochrome c family protein
MLRPLCAIALLLMGACNDDFLLPREEADGDQIDEILALTPDTTAGESSFTSRCSGCHNADGTAAIGPSLSEWLAANDDAATLTVIIEGQGAMPAFNLESQELADILGWMKENFAGDQPDPALTLPGDVTAGETVFVDNCSSCHNINGDAGPIGSSMAAWVPMHEPADALEVLREGRAPMPSFNSLSDQELANVLAWLFETFGA